MTKQQYRDREKEAMRKWREECWIEDNKNFIPNRSYHFNPVTSHPYPPDDVSNGGKQIYFLPKDISRD